MLLLLGRKAKNINYKTLIKTVDLRSCAPFDVLSDCNNLLPEHFLQSLPFKAKGGAPVLASSENGTQIKYFQFARSQAIVKKG
jgi:hypothetical protein